MKRPVVVASDPQPRTLSEAHAALVRLRPRRDAPLAAWHAFHVVSARVYAEVAEVDRGHHHEALSYWAARERQAAEEIAEQIAQGPRKKTSAPE